MPAPVRAALRLILPALLPVCTAGAQQFQLQTSSRFPNPNPADYTNYIAVSDIDNDGDLDVIFANGGNFSSAGTNQLVRIFVNDGSAVFTDESILRTGGLAGIFRSVATGDVDRDGDEDLILAADFNRQAQLLINDGFGYYANETVPRLPAITTSSTRAQFGDIDNDGDLDIYINNGGTTNRFGCGQNRVWINNGTGHFADQTNIRHPGGAVCEPMDVIFGDIDNDLDLDVRTGNRGSNNSKLYRNSGAGVFSLITGVPADSMCYSYDFGDVNGDGNLDMIGANAGPSNQELLLLGDGTGSGWTNASSGISPNPNADDNDSKFFDLDNDGDLDLIIAALGQSREKIYINNGSGGFTQALGIITDRNDSTMDVAVADFDNDGDFDIITAQGESGNFTNQIYINTTGPADTRAPRIIRMDLVDGDAQPEGPWIIRATIWDDVTSDRGFFDRGVHLNWTVDGGDVQQVPMDWSGNSLWRGVLPAATGRITYWVTALDWASNPGTGSTHTFVIAADPADLDGDGTVGFSDLLILLGAWGPCADPCPADLDGDGEVGFGDLLLLLSAWSS
ncbi:MAG: VCBS repeat-containing protein [Phycisphaeraceae bacterium]|nr:VCBS repeat-containing protein [Phycisphaeraceae bacterium]